MVKKAFLRFYRNSRGPTSRGLSAGSRKVVGSLDSADKPRNVVSSLLEQTPTIPVEPFLTTLTSRLLTVFDLRSLISRWQRRQHIKRWSKALNLPQHIATYQQLSKDIHGFALSKQARIQHDAIEYTYGEIDFMSLIALLSLTKPHTETVFYDLGSGIGNVVLACAMIFPVQKSCGIERFTLLHESAIKQQKRLQALPGYQKSAKAIHWINADYLQTNLQDATLVFINSTALFGESWIQLNQHLDQLQEGTTVITTSKKLTHADFKLIKTTRVQMSFGVVSAYIQQRITCP